MFLKNLSLFVHRLIHCNNTLDPLVRVVTLPNLRKIIAPGIEFKGLQPTIIPRKGQRGNLALDKFTFCPFVEKTSGEDMKPHVSEMVDLVLDNCRTKELKVVDVFTNKDNSLAKLYHQILSRKPMQQVYIRTGKIFKSL